MALREQVLFDNLRRWAGWDLLCGRVTPDHPMWRRIADAGLGDRLRAIADDPCPPDVIGINHYLTSDRFLDHRLPRYPAHVRGGNDRQAYCDLEAVRVLEPGPPGLEGALREAWSRYAIPLAVTEAHNGCTREEQMRWMEEAWATATRLRAEGVTIQAVTNWGAARQPRLEYVAHQAGRVRTRRLRRQRRLAASHRDRAAAAHAGNGTGTAGDCDGSWLVALARPV